MNTSALVRSELKYATEITVTKHLVPEGAGAVTVVKIAVTFQTQDAAQAFFDQALQLQLRPA